MHFFLKSIKQRERLHCVCLLTFVLGLKLISKTLQSHAGIWKCCHTELWFSTAPVPFWAYRQSIVRQETDNNNIFTNKQKNVFTSWSVIEKLIYTKSLRSGTLWVADSQQQTYVYLFIQLLKSNFRMSLNFDRGLQMVPLVLKLTMKHVNYIIIHSLLNQINKQTNQSIK